MQVILLKPVKELGNVGDIKEVKSGFATNFLIPQGLASQATAKAIQDMKNKKEKKVKQSKKDLEKNKALAKKLNGVKVILKAKADKENKTLFGAINESVLAKELKSRKYDIEAKYIKLEEPIKKLGFYDVVIEFDPETRVKIGVNVTPDE